MTAPTVPNGLTVPEVAQRIKRSERQVWNLIRSGALDSFSWECRRLVAPEVVDTYLAERGTGPAGGAGTGSGNGSSSGSGSTNTGGGAGTGPNRT
jgi:hypothetical protein